MKKGLSVQELVLLLGLKPHPEGGYFVETFRSPDQVTLSDGRRRSAGTAIYFLLPSGSFSALHRVRSDETWHFYDGDCLELTTVTPEGILERRRLGREIDAGVLPQHVVPAGVWQAARPVTPPGGSAGYTLVGCTVAPGFDFADFDMPARRELVRLFPEHAAAITELTRA